MTTTNATPTPTRSSELRRRRVARSRACSEVVGAFARQPKSLEQAVRGIVAIEVLLQLLTQDRAELEQLVLERVAKTQREVTAGGYTLKVSPSTKYTLATEEFVQGIDELVEAGVIDRKLRNAIVGMTDPKPAEPKVLKTDLDKAMRLGIPELNALANQCIEYVDQPRRLTGIERAPEEALAA